MYQYSDSESRDSDEGIRFKTDSTRFKNNEKSSRFRSRSRSPPRKDRSRHSNKTRTLRRERSSSSDQSPPRRIDRKSRRKEPVRAVSPSYKVKKNLCSPEKKQVETKQSPRKVAERSSKRKEEVEKSTKRKEEVEKSSKRKEEVEKSTKRKEAVETVVGPALPPQLLKKISPSPEEEQVDNAVIGPVLPPHLLKEISSSEDEEKYIETAVIGPVLPSHLLKKPSSEEDAKEADSFGPQLPSQLFNKQPKSEESCSIGPHLPPHLRKQLEEKADTSYSNVNEESDDGDVYGPLPVGATNYSKAQIALEERALQLKMDQLEPSQNKDPVREEWMIELPEVKASNLGLGPRQFRSKAGPDLSDRSSWTDTPNKKEKTEEVDLKKETEIKEIRRRDEEQSKIAKKHKKKNKDSLLELHQSEMKKQKKEEGPSERRPFSRDIDLKVNRFDEAQKKAILKKAQLLDDRFSSGQSKFL